MAAGSLSSATRKGKAFVSVIYTGENQGNAGSDSGAEHVADELAPYLQRVEKQLREIVTSAPGKLHELSLHLLEAGGKRLRPRLVLASAIAADGADGVTQRVFDAAVAVELLHLATLYHDDVLDSAEVRRGKPSANRLWGNHDAVLAGDALLSSAFFTASGLGARELRRFSQTVEELCHGQIAETGTQFDATRAIDDYYSSIRGKTGALLATCCWLGAATVDAPARIADALDDYGRELGTAFQIIDDILDLCDDGRLSGKGGGTDVREGIFTLPILLALRRDPSLAGLLTRGMGEDGVGHVRHRVRAIGSDREAAQIAEGHIAWAFDALGRATLRPAGEAILVSAVAGVARSLAQLGLSSDQGEVLASRVSVIAETSAAA